MENKIEQIKRLLENPRWESQFSEREIKEIRFSCEYVDEYNHGTDGHLVKNVVSKMAALLDMMEDCLLSTEEGANVTSVYSVGKHELSENKIVGNTLYLKNGTFISFPGGAWLAKEILTNFTEI